MNNAERHHGPETEPNWPVVLITFALGHLRSAQDMLADMRLQEAQEERLRLVLHEVEERLLTAKQEALVRKAERLI